MLSAIAVRKAAQAALKSSQPLNSDKPSTPSTPSRSPSPDFIPDLSCNSNPLPSKRKSSSANGKPSRKSKKTKLLPGRAPRTSRYFDSKNATEREDDVIMLGSSSDSESDVEVQPIIPASQPSVPLIAPAVDKGRSWSPSRPSPDQEAEEGPNPIPPTNLPSYPQPSGYQPLQLSTFRPLRDSNFFELSAEEISTVGLQAETIVVSIDREETLALLGTYALTVLKGSVSILGATLSASKIAHRVFACRFAPIPILRCVALDAHPDSNLPSLPPRIRHITGGAVLAIQSLETGVEGLGRVCRVFDGVFEPSRWQRSSAEVILPGVSLVCVQFIYICGCIVNEIFTGDAQYKRRTAVRVATIMECFPGRCRHATVLGRSSTAFSIYCQGSEKVWEEHVCSDAFEQAFGEVRSPLSVGQYCQQYFSDFSASLISNAM